VKSDGCLTSVGRSNFNSASVPGKAVGFQFVREVVYGGHGAARGLGKVELLACNPANGGTAVVSERSLKVGCTAVRVR
jgi:hypothetical protein